MTATRASIDTVIALFEREGYARAEPAILQPAEPFLDLSGEDIRRRIFLTQDLDGREWCLRPEYTIPVALAHIAARSTEPASYAYAGPVFRMRANEPGEFAQAGIESFGREDVAAADAEIMALAVEAVAALGLAQPRLLMGDVALLAALLDGLGVPQAARRRLMRAVAQGKGADAVSALDAPAAATEATHAGLLKALEGQDPKAARAFVEDVLSIAGISTVGGRSAGDIAERFLARAAERDNPVSDEARALLGRALAISGDPDSASAAWRKLAGEAGLDLAAALDVFDERTGFLAARGVDVGNIGFSAAFARNLDYYTGFIFELHDPAKPELKPIAGGGRYDGVLQRLGAPGPVAAVGASVWLDRLAGGDDMSGAENTMNDAPLVLAVPSKGRLQENATAFFGRAGLSFVQARGSREYRAAIAGLEGAEVAFLSASEIVAQLASGAVHLGITGEDLVREQVSDADAAIELLTPLGFGNANVVVAVPQAWIDVRTMADLDDVAATMRARTGNKLRVATKYVNLTRRFFASHGLADYRIVESLGATEGAPAAGTAEIVVDITTTGSTLVANALKVLDDGVMLASEANLVASVRAPWGERARNAAAAILGRIAAEEEARSLREVRAVLHAVSPQRLAEIAQRLGARLPFGAGGEDGVVTLHCPKKAVFPLVEELTRAGADDITVRALDYVFRRTNPLIERLQARI